MGTVRIGAVWVAAAAACAAIAACAGASGEPSTTTLWVHAGDISVEVGASGVVSLNTSEWVVPSPSALGAVAGAVQSAQVALCGRPAEAGTACVSRVVEAAGGLVGVEDKFVPLELVDGSKVLLWTVSAVAVNASIPGFSTFINMSLSFDSPADGAWWVPRQGDPVSSDEPFEDVLEMRGSSDEELRLKYGVGGYAYQWGNDRESTPLPLGAFAGGASAHNAGIFIAHSLNDTETTRAAIVDAGPSHFVWANQASKLGGGLSTPHNISVIIGRTAPALDGKACWRGAALRMAVAFPSYFTPTADIIGDQLDSHSSPTANVGMGLYSCSSVGDMNLTAVVDLSGATHNWDASFWWPYIGMALPPVSVPVWQSYLGTGEQPACGAHFQHGAVVNRSTIRSSYRASKAANLTTMAYFNLFEFGHNVVWPLPGPVDPPPQNDWKNSSAYIANHFRSPGALLRSKAGGSPTYTWANAVVLDPSSEDWASFVRSEAAQKVAVFGSDFSGIAIDRLDWTSSYNHDADDQLSWCGAPCRYMLPGWMRLGAEVSKAVRSGSAGTSRLITINYNGAGRIGLLRDMDGIFSEDGPAAQHGSVAQVDAIGLSTFGMPAMLWTYDEQELLSSPSGVAGFFQWRLYQNVQPFAPVSGGDHSIMPDPSAPWLQRNYTAYGPLFRLIRGSTWWLEARAVSIVSATCADTRVNAFLQRGSGFLVPRQDVAVTVLLPIVRGRAGSTVTLSLMGSLAVAGNKPQCSSVEPLYPPQGQKPVPQASIVWVDGGGWHITVRLEVGAALLLCSIA